MLRQFSLQRILVFFLIDWLGSLLTLWAAAVLVERPLAQVELLLVAVIWPFVFIPLSVYDCRRLQTRASELRRVALAVGLSSLVLAGSLFLFTRHASRMLFLVFLILDLILLVGARLALWALRRLQGKTGQPDSRRLLVVGAGQVGCKAVRELRKYAWSGIQLVGFIDDDPEKRASLLEDLPVLGALDQAAAIAKSHRVDNALVALPLRAHQRLVETCRLLQEQGVHVHVVPDLFSLSFQNATLDGFGGIPVIDLGQPGQPDLYRVCKRSFDLLGASLLLLLLSPLLLITALLIKLETPGPVLYRQLRIGQRGKPFHMFKFRSMQNNAADGVHKEHVTRLIRENIDPSNGGSSNNNSLKIEHDPRVTRVGRLIRKTSIDEFPQFINVLRGEMSLVGPRPPLPYEVDLYQDWHRRRLVSMPGVTGWWQVKGRNRVSFDEAVRMDLYYIEHASFWLDLKILLLTPWAMFSGRGAG